MSTDQLGSLTYLVLLGVVVGGYFLIANRRSLGRLARHATLWVLIFFGVVVGAGLWSDLQRTVAPRQSVFAEDSRIELPRAPDRHYYLTAQVNGAPIRFVVDTGATEIVLSQDDARRAGVDPDSLTYIGSATTANGQVQTARIALDEVALGPIVDTKVPALVNSGEMRGSLLGMAYLDRWGRIEINDGRMTLTR